MKRTRIENSKRNIVFGLLGRIVQLVFKFIIRTIIIYYLGAVYLGLDGLFLNVITILSIAELGIGNAICFELYKPFSENNNEKIAAYMHWYKRVYAVLGFIVLIMGGICVPVLKYIVQFDNSIEISYYVIYLMFLLNTVFSYWFGAYYQVLFTADQRDYVVNNTKNILYVVMALAQIIVIVLTKNYYLYLLIMIVCNMITNLAIASLAKREYPVIIKAENYNMLDAAEITSLKKNVFALSLTKLSSVIYTSSDNIIISAFIGTIMVGYYSNYAYIVSAVSGIIAIIFSSLLASIGNANATESADKMHLIFKRMLYMNSIIYGMCFVFFMQLFQDFIYLWAGESFLLDDITVFMIGLLFLLPGLNHTCTLFKDACGLFWETRYRTVATAFVNIILSILFVPKFGLSGIFAATIMAYFLTVFIVDPQLIQRKILKTSSKEFYIWYLKAAITAVLINFIINRLLQKMQVTSWMVFGLKALLVGLLSGFLYYMMTCRTKEFSFYKEMVKNGIRKKAK